MTAISHFTLPENQGKKIEREQTHDLIRLDFHEYGIEEKLLELLDMAKAGKINGLIFSARMTHKGDEPYLFGCEGRLLDNQAEAIGAAVLLQNKMATEW